MEKPKNLHACTTHEIGGGNAGRNGGAGQRGIQGRTKKNGATVIV